MSHHDLEDALNFWRTEIELDAFDVVPQERFLVLMDAARLVERLLPGECEHGETTEHGAFRPGVPGSSWMCPGQVWDEGIVEAVAEAIVAEYRKGRGDSRVNEMARAVLSVLVELLTEKAER